MPEGQDAGRLYAQIEQLQQQVRTLEAENKRLGTENEQFAAALEEQMTLSEQLQAKVKELEPNGPIVDELKGKLRGLMHERAFEKLAEELNLKPEAVQDVWKLGEYKAEADEPDATKLREHFARFLDGEGRKELYTADGGGKKRLSKGEGADRGGGKEPDPRPKITREQAGDPEWMFKNQDALAKASREGNAPQFVN